MKKIWLTGTFLITAVVVVGLTGCTKSPTATPGTTLTNTSPIVNTQTQHVVGTVSGPGANYLNTTFIPAPSTISPDQQSGIWVSGTGVISVAPDTVNINLGVQVQDTSVVAAQTRASSAMNKVNAVLKTNNIADRDIQTTQFSINPVYTYNNATYQNIITGYSVTNTVNVTIRNLDKIGSIIDTVAAAGGDIVVINGISFSVSDPTQYYEHARQLAMNDALAQAQELATLGEVTLGSPVYITENTGFSSNPVYYTKSAAEGSVQTSINAGQTDITVTVQVGYSIS